MLSAYKTEAKNKKLSKSASAYSFKVRSPAPRRSSSTSPTGSPEKESVAKKDASGANVGEMNVLLAQPFWATQLQNMISNVREEEQQQQLRSAMLQYSTDNSSCKTDFLLPHECRYEPEPALYTIGRCLPICDSLDMSWPHSVQLPVTPHNWQVSRGVQWLGEAVYGFVSNTSILLQS